MDTLTHLMFAARVLACAGGDTDAAAASLLPDLDREPAYLHRLYAHTFGRTTHVIRKAAPILYAVHDPWPGELEWIQGRCAQERPRITSYLRRYAEHQDSRLPLPPPACIEGAVPEHDSLLLAYVSRLYIEHLSTPLQPFLPWSAEPCGRWELWERREPLKFRLSLFQPGNVEAMRARVVRHEAWTRPMDATHLINAMVTRLARAGRQPVGVQVQRSALASLGVPDALDAAETSAVIATLETFEDDMDQAVEDCTGPGFSPGRQRNGSLLEPS